MTELEKICLAAKEAAQPLSLLSAETKNAMLACAAQAVTDRAGEILAANARDLRENADQPQYMLDRLALSPERLEGMAKGMREVMALPDPVGEILEEFDRPNGLHLVKKRVPLGVIGIIYEARPNVTTDTAALCLKSGNCVVLRGSRAALHSNTALVSAMKEALKKEGFLSEAIQFIPDTSREGAQAMMKLNGLIDVLLPRGGAGLIASVVQNATIPVIETGTGNCHIYVEKTADLAMAADIVRNAKCSRPSVCNAAESLLVDEAVAAEFLPLCAEALRPWKVTLYGCPRTQAILPEALPAAEQDYFAEYLDYKMSVKVISGVEEAVRHINRYGTHHSDAICTRDPAAAQVFLDGVDSAAVYVNASTRFTDGGEFGFGCELGISTQKLHARGPVGLKELTSYKYCVTGSGQIRE